MSNIDGTTNWALAVYVLVHDAKGRVLLLRRSQARNHFPGCWELPGGKPAVGESIDTTAKLEVSEESDLYAPITGVAGAAEGSIRGLRVAMLILEGRTRKTKVTLSDEHDTFCWLPPDKACELNLRPGFDVFLANYVRQHAGKTVAKKKTAPQPRAKRPSKR